jgi:N-acetylated-alpha-linked acidic dipeptidase
VVEWLGAAGLEVGYDSLVLYMPHPERVAVERLSPEPMTLELLEPALASDPATQGEAVPVFSAYSGTGSAEGEVVFVNYGLPADYQLLDSLGVSVAGKVLVARYGRSFRGIKAREAEKRGAAALLLYSDPASDGFERGEVYPGGPMRPPRGVQRGSVLNATGDPSTPTEPSVPGAARVPEERMRGVPGIPVVPVGYGAIAELIGPLGGPEVPESWQGGLGFTYRVGPGPTVARVEVQTERGDAAYHPAFNTIAAIPGTTWPDEWVIIGAHRDAWSPGSIDNVSGTTSVVAVARAFAAAAARGFRPRRTVVFATWDAEEWGVIGSIEWVEANAERLRASGVAYINQDAVVSGSRFGGGASPEMKSLLLEVVREVADPETGRSVYEEWRERSVAAGSDGTGEVAPSVGDLGGGSDHKGFYQHIGIPALGFGFGGRGGVYHSMYDTPTWMERFGDPGYRYHATVARIAAVAMARLANADVIPLDHVSMARIIRERLDKLEADAMEVAGALQTGEPGIGDAAAEGGPNGSAAELRADLLALRERLALFGAEAEAVAAARNEWLAGAPPDPRTAGLVNSRLREVGFALTSDKGLPGDSWSRQVLFASDPDNGYAALPLPAARLALRAGNLREMGHRLRALGGSLERAAGFLAEARGVLEKR